MSEGTGSQPGAEDDAGDGAVHAIAPELLEILRCPACLGEFGPPAPAELVCTSCGLRYPIRNGVPILLVDEAKPSTGGGDTGRRA